MHGRLLLGAASVLISLASCTPPSPPVPSAAGKAAPVRAVMALQPIPFGALPGWRRDATAAALPAFLSACAAMRAGQSLGGDGQAAERGGGQAAWRAACAAARSVSPGDDTQARAFFETAMQPYAVTADQSATGLFTGYYEPEVDGALVRGGRYQTPLLAPPGDIVQADLGAFASDLAGRSVSGRVVGGRFVPYYERAEIDRGALVGRGLERLWLADPVDAFFLEIQGSGRVRLADGRVVRVGYAGQNGRPYVPIGRVLIEQGALERGAVSLQTIRAWLAAHPDQAQAVMDRNPSYVFFRDLGPVPPDRGPPGSLGAPLVPGRSLAVDRSFLPLGAPVWIDTTDPLDGSKLQRLMVAADTGGAIKGPVRGDVFWGWGAEAQERAGRMRSSGEAYILLPRAAEVAARE